MTDYVEEPHISSTLQWQDVSLPASVRVTDVDELIFATLERNWRKTAFIIGTCVQICEARSIPINAEIIGARIQALADDRRIEAQGNLSMWRHSEIRRRQD